MNHGIGEEKLVSEERLEMGTNRTGVYINDDMSRETKFSLMVPLSPSEQREVELTYGQYQINRENVKIIFLDVLASLEPTMSVCVSVCLCVTISLQKPISHPNEVISSANFQDKFLGVSQDNPTRQG